MISIDTARKWDRLLGIPMCRIISLFRIFSSKTNPVSLHIKKIVIIKMWGMGSLVLLGPSVLALKKNYPEAEITLVTLDSNRGLFDYNSEFREIRYTRLSSFISLLSDTFQLVRWTWKYKPDIIIDFETASRYTALLSFICSHKISVGFTPAGSGKNIFDITVPYHESVHVSDLFLRCVDGLNVRLQQKEWISIPISEPNKFFVESWLKENKIDSFILINPNTSKLAEERLWPLEYFAQLINRFHTEFPNMHVIIIGNAFESFRAENILSLISDKNLTTNSAGVFNINQLYFLIQRAKIFVTNDSGPAQLGFLSQTPTIALYGPETPLLYGPNNPTLHKALSANEPCSPCISIFNDKVVSCSKNAICMIHLSVDHVFHEVRESINKNVNIT